MKDVDDTLTGAAAILVGDIKSLIYGTFPDATFNVRVGPDGRVYLAVYTDEVQDFAIQRLVAERTVDALIAGDVKVHVFPRRRPAPYSTPPSPR